MCLLATWSVLVQFSTSGGHTIRPELKELIPSYTFHRLEADVMVCLSSVVCVCVCVCVWFLVTAQNVYSVSPEG